MIADTDFLISLLEQDPGAHEKLRELEAASVSVKIPAMAMLELYIGVGAELSEAEGQRVTEVLQGHPFVPMDEHIAMRAGRLIGERGATKFKKMKGDAAIAATAYVEGEPVLTRNVDDFERFGAEVEPY